MKSAGSMGINYMQKLLTSNVPKELVKKGQDRVVEASLTLIRERAKLKVCMAWKNVILSGAHNDMLHITIT